MTGEVTPFDASGFQAQLDEAQAALQSFAESGAREAAEDMSEAFERAGARIARALGAASVSGEASFKRLAKIVLEELAKIALDRLFAQGAGASVGSRASAAGASASGLLGSQAAVARPTALSSAGVAVHFHLGAGADASAIVRHQGQIAAQIARAVVYGRRNL